MSAYCELTQLGKTYPSPKGPAVIVQDFNLKIQKGEFVCLIGHSGCGKSTRLSMVAALMVTHDVDESLFLSDRVVCMTDGPAATIGDIVPVTFPRPRNRKAIMEH